MVALLYSEVGYGSQGCKESTQLSVWTTTMSISWLRGPLLRLPYLWTSKQHKITSVQFSHSAVPDSLQPHGLQHVRLHGLSATPRAYSNSCSSSQWFHLTISSSVSPFSSCPQSFPALGFFQISQFFTSSGQSIRVSASAPVLPINIQD